MAVSGLSVVGRDKYGVFPLKGKVMNVRDATTEQIMKNVEITNLKKIVGLELCDTLHKDACESLDKLYTLLPKQAKYDRKNNHGKT